MLVFKDFIYSRAWSLKILTTPEPTPLHGFLQNLHHGFTLSHDPLIWFAILLMRIELAVAVSAAATLIGDVQELSPERSGQISNQFDFSQPFPQLKA